MASAGEEDNAEEKAKDGVPVAVGEWFHAFPIQNIISTVVVFEASTLVHPFTTELSWRSHRYTLVGFSGSLH